MKSANNEWEMAAKQAKIELPRHLLSIEPEHQTGWKKGCGFVLIHFRFKDMTEWASTSMLVDGHLEKSWVEELKGLPSGSIKTNVASMNVNLGTRRIKMAEFRGRYPDVPWNMSYRFVLMHEVGHVLCGSREDKADAYAFASLKLEQSQAGIEARGKMYEKIHARYEKQFALMCGPNDTRA